MIPQINRDRNFLRRVCFTDECTLTPKGMLNKQNHRFWARQNPRWTRIVHTRSRWRLMVWAGIVGDRLVGPHFFDGNLNGDMYLEFLQNNLRGLLHDNPIRLQDMWWQQDGAPAHNTNEVQDCLDEIFGDRWIGLWGPHEWPPRSPDLTPLDFYLWSRIRDLCYLTPATTREDMMERVRAAFATITPRELARVRRHNLRRLQCLVRQQGGHIEQHL